MSLRPSTLALGMFSLGIAAFILSFFDASRLAEARSPARAETAALAAKLGLTDLALCTEARYTRHPTQADLHSAFQDHPLALDHFPSGSFIPPRRHDPLDRKTAEPD